MKKKFIILSIVFLLVNFLILGFLYFKEKSLSKKTFKKDQFFSLNKGLYDINSKKTKLAFVLETITSEDVIFYNDISGLFSSQKGFDLDILVFTEKVNLNLIVDEKKSSIWYFDKASEIISGLTKNRYYLFGKDRKLIADATHTIDVRKTFISVREKLKIPYKKWSLKEFVQNTKFLNDIEIINSVSPFFKEGNFGIAAFLDIPCNLCPSGSIVFKLNEFKKNNPNFQITLFLPNMYTQNDLDNLKSNNGFSLNFALMPTLIEEYQKDILNNQIQYSINGLIIIFNKKLETINSFDLFDTSNTFDKKTGTDFTNYLKELSAREGINAN